MTTTTGIQAYTFDELSEDIQQRVLDKHRDINACDEYWYEDIFCGFLESAKAKGWDIDKNKIHFSGFYSQGDGACFEGDKMVTREEIMERLGREKVLELAAFNKFYKESPALKPEQAYDLFEKEEERELMRMKAVILLKGEIDKWLPELDGFRVDITTSGRYCHSGTMTESHEGPAFDLWDVDEIAWLISDTADEIADGVLEEAKEMADKLFDDLRMEYEYQTSDEAIKETIEANDWLFDEDGELV